jgi:hypothetical protein
LIGYTKLHAGIVTSTVWSYDSDTRVVWVTLLALADADGVVIGTAPGLARVANVSLEAMRKALSIFESPDPDSSTPDEDGRRIVKVDRGWRLVTHAKYRALRSAEQKREADRERIAAKRAAEKSHDFDDVAECRISSPKSPGIAEVAHTEAEAEAESGERESGSPLDPPLAPRSLPDPDPDPPANVIQVQVVPSSGFATFWTAYPRKTGKAVALKAWQKLRPPIDRVLAALEWQRASPDWLKDGGQFIPHPATWLNGGRWDDEPPQPGPRYDPAMEEMRATGEAWLEKRRRERGP